MFSRMPRSGRPGWCPNPVPYKTTCRHGESGGAVELIPCGRKDCRECQEKWRWSVYCDIRHGCETLGANQARLVFGTFTLKGDDPTVERLSDAWRQFERNYLSRRCPGALTYRVFEAGGRPHVHFVTTADLPVVPKVGRRERKAAWEARLTPEAREFQARVVGAGFGPILHAEVAHTSGGVAAYLAGYVSKGERRLTGAAGRRVRLTGCSRAWPRMRPGRTYRVGQVQRAPDGTPERPCPECEHEHQAAAEVRAATGSNDGYDAIRRRNVESWLRPALLDPSMRDTVQQLYEARKEYYRQAPDESRP